MENQWIIEIEALRKMKAEVEKLIRQTERELKKEDSEPLWLLSVLLDGLEASLTDTPVSTKPVRYVKTYRHGVSGLEEVRDVPILD